MRVFAFAAIASLGLAAASGAAQARVWDDPGGRVSFDAPSSWSVMDQQQPNMTYVIVGNADVECHVLAIPRPETAAASARAVYIAGGADATYTDEAWARTANGITTVFPGASAHVVSRASEKDGRFWPIQRAEIQGPARIVHGAIQIRPGLELQTYCQTYEGAEPMADYDALIRSVATPNDAALQAQAEQQLSEQTAQDEAAAAANVPAQEENASRRRRNN